MPCSARESASCAEERFRPQAAMSCRQAAGAGQGGRARRQGKEAGQGGRAAWRHAGFEALTSTCDCAIGHGGRVSPAKTCTAVKGVARENCRAHVGRTWFHTAATTPCKSPSTLCSSLCFNALRDSDTVLVITRTLHTSQASESASRLSASHLSSKSVKRPPPSARQRFRMRATPRCLYMRATPSLFWQSLWRQTRCSPDAQTPGSLF
jgi:hypothetical protein